MKLTIQERKDFYTYVYKHLYNIPAQSIQEAVVLVSPANETVQIIQKFLGKQLPKSQHKFPQMCTLKQNITLIHPTEGLLNPNEKHKFVTMHYIFKTVKQVKFIFVFSESDFRSNGAKNIKSTLKGLLSFFTDEKDSDNLLAKLQLSKSCAILVTDPKRTVEQYRNFLKRTYEEPKFLDSEAAKAFTSKLVTEQPMELFDKNCNDQTMIQFLEPLQSLKLQGKYSFRLQSSQNLYSEIKGQENRWLQILSDQILKKIPQQVLDPSPRFQQNILGVIKQFNVAVPPHFNGAARQWQEEYKQLVGNGDVRQVALYKFIQGYLYIIKYITQIIGNQQVYQSHHLLELTLKAFYCSGYLKSLTVEYFFISYLQIDRFLRDVTFQMTNFKQAFISKNQILNEALGQISTVGLQRIQQVLNTCDQSYPFQKTINIIDKLVSCDKSAAKEQCLFWTSRIDKKYKKYRAELAYKQAYFLNIQYAAPKINRYKAWITFLEYSNSSTLIDPVKNEKALTIIADILTQARQYEQALKIYDLMPEYQVYNKVIKIYEKEMKLYPEILRYTLQENWQAKAKYLQDFCAFLMKIGLNEKVRQLCLQGLRVTAENGNLMGKQLFNKILIDARSSKSQLLHEQFLENSILKPKVIRFNRDLLKQIRQKERSL